MFEGRFMRAAVRISAICVLIAASGGLRLAASVYAAQTGNQGDAPAEQVYKNIQALKGTPASQIKMLMNLISISVGMRCEQCHEVDAYEKDDKRSKQTARKMIQMTLDVNKSSFEGQAQVSCYSCHRGQGQPVPAPPIGPPVAGQRPSTAGLPTFDQIVDKYLQAVGSAEAYGKLKTRVMKGTIADAKGATSAVEVYQSAPGKMVTTAMLPSGTTAQGYNGSTGWATTPGGQIELQGAALAQLKRSADIARPLRLREECLSPRVLGKVRLGDNDAYQVSGRADGLRVQLWFDAQTGLLLRRRVINATVVGTFPEQTEYDDYREVDGVKLPFVVRYNTPDPAAATTTTFKDITHNRPVEDGMFNPPPQK